MNAVLTFENDAAAAQARQVSREVVLMTLLGGMGAFAGPVLGVFTRGLLRCGNVASGIPFRSRR